MSGPIIGFGIPFHKNANRPGFQESASWQYNRSRLIRAIVFDDHSPPAVLDDVLGFTEVLKMAENNFHTLPRRR